MSLRRSYGAIALCLFSLSSYANEADIVIEIDSRSPTPVNEASPFSKVITREDIAQSGYQSLSEILAGSGLLHVSGASSGYNAGGSPDLRGFGERAAQNTLILFNGRPLNNATLEGPDLSTIPLNTISRVEILNASAGVLYGNGAVGGVVNIISDQTTKREHTESKFKAGSFGTAQFSSTISRSLQAGGHLYARCLCRHHRRVSGLYREYEIVRSDELLSTFFKWQCELRTRPVKDRWISFWRRRRECSYGKP